MRDLASPAGVNYALVSATAPQIARLRLAACQEPQYLAMAVGPRPVSGGLPIQPLEIGGGTAGQEGGNRRGLAFLSRPDQGCPAAAALLMVQE